MTLLDVGFVDLAGPTFERDISVLEHSGVSLETPQYAMLYDALGGTHNYGATGHAMTPWPLRDPRNGSTMVALDQNTGLFRHVLVPAIVELDHVAWAEVANSEAEQRFPSLAGRVVLPSLHGRSSGDAVLGDPTVFRLWDLWPITEAETVDLFYVLQTALLHPPYIHLVDLSRVMAGFDEPCEIVPEDYGRHVHEYDDDKGLGDFRCLTAEDMAQDYLDTYYVELANRATVTKAFDPLLALKWPMNESWDRLVRSSSRNTKRALESYPPDQRVSITDSERTYSPWLLS